MSYSINAPSVEELDLWPRGKPEATLWLFAGDCGHRWIGAGAGTYECPVCGRYSGDHHLTEMLELPVQLKDWCGGDVFRGVADKAAELVRAEQDAREEWLESRVGELEAELAKHTGNGR